VDGERVKQFGMVDVALTSQEAYANPFAEVVAHAEVTLPDRTLRKVRCFHDGDGKGGQTGPVWRFRYMPEQPGDYTFEVHSDDQGLNATKGSFRCVASKWKGPLRPSPHNPQLTAYANGDSYVPVGDCAFFLLSDDWAQKDRLAWVNAVAAKGVNKIILCLVNNDGPPVIPWLGNRQTLDHSRYDLARMKQWDEVVAHMRDRSVIAYLWFYSDDSGALYPPAGSDVETQYFQYIVARFAAYENVVWNLALEYAEYRNDDWARKTVTLVKAEDPSAHLVAIHQGVDYPKGLLGSDIDVYSSQTRPDLARIAQQVSEITLANQARAQAAGKPIAFWTEEWVYEPDEGQRRAVLDLMWASTLQGAGFTIMSGNFWGRPGRVAWWNDLDAVVAKLMARVKGYQEMSVHNDLVDKGGETKFCMAQPGVEYLVLTLDSADVVLDLTATSGTFAAEWWNIETGAVTPADPQPGGGKAFFAVPQTPAVLHLTR